MPLQALLRSARKWILIPLGFGLGASVLTIGLGVLSPGNVPAREHVVAMQFFQGNMYIETWIWKRTFATWMTEFPVRKRLEQGIDWNGEVIDPPSWIPDRTMDQAESRWLYREFRAFGWPFRASFIEFTQDDKLSGKNTPVGAAIELPSGPYLRSKFLPNRVIPLGLGADIAIFAALYIALAAAASTSISRWRYQRGLCQKCGHLLANARICPECGCSARSTSVEMIRPKSTCP